MPTDPSTVEKRMKEFQHLLLIKDTETIFQMGNRWLVLEESLNDAIQLLILEITAAGADVSIASVYRLERYKKLLAQVQIELKAYNMWAAAEIAQKQAQMGALGLSHSAEILSLTLLETGSAAFFDRLPVSAVQYMVGNAGKGGPLYALLESKYPEAVVQMTDALVKNVALGIGPRATAKAMVEGLQVSLNYVLTVARTEQLRVYREASRAQYEESGAVINYRRFASKDGNTCALCLALDGELYKTKDLMSVHPNDRCMMIPVVAGVDEITWESGEDWLKKQDIQLQEQVLGKKAAELWNNGDIELMDLVKKVEHPIWGPSLKRTPLKDLGVDLGGSPIAPDIMPPTGGVNFRTKEEAIEGLRARTINGGVYPNGTDIYGPEAFDLSIEEASIIANALDNTVERYGLNFNGVYKSELFDNVNTIMVTSYDGSSNVIKINKNADWSLFDKAAERSLEIGERLTLARDFEDAFYHELGHVALLSQSDEIWEKAIRLYNNNSHVLSAISRYASTDHQEMVAEAFLNFERNIGPESASLTDLIMKELFGMVR